MVHLGAERLTESAAVRMFVVIEDHFLIHLLHAHDSVQLPCDTEKFLRTLDRGNENIDFRGGVV